MKVLGLMQFLFFKRVIAPADIVLDNYPISALYLLEEKVTSLHLPFLTSSFNFYL